MKTYYGAKGLAWMKCKNGLLEGGISKFFEESIQRDMAVLTDKVNLITGKLERAEGTWEMAENLYEVLANKVNEMEWDIKDLNREINY